MAIPLLRTKFYIPPPQPGLVHRPRLTQLINDGLYRKLTLVSAPAGFGKTTLLSEWIPTSRRPVAWLSVEESDNDPARFWAYLLAALQVLQENLVREAQDFLQAEGQGIRFTQPNAIITILINNLSDYSKEFALTLDDYHQIHNQTIHEGMIFLIDHLPQNMHLLFTCRADPPLPLARLRARGQMTELRAEDLRFTTEEIVLFLNQNMKLNLSVDQITALEARTEGWIAGLQLVAISMQKHGNAREFIESFTGSHRFILDYLVDEVLSCQSEEIQLFLLQTSILDRFTGPLCNVVTGKKDGQEMLELLEQLNLFVIPLDSERHWYRYHRLFADLLRSRLQEVPPDQVRELHQHACEWFEREGLLPEAIQHAITMRDFEKAAGLIEATAEIQRERGEIATLTAWMEALPVSVRRSHPALCLVYARALTDTAQSLFVEALIEDAEAGLEEDSSPSSSQSASLQGQITALRAYLAMIRHQYEVTVELSHQARELLGEGEARWRSFVEINLASAYRFSNDWAAAGQAYLEASDLSRSAGDIVNALLALSLRSEVLQAQGQLHQAVVENEQILQLARELAIPNAPVTGYALIGLGRIWCEWNEIDAAELYVRDGIELGKKAGIQDLLLRGYIVLARIQQARGNFEEALSAIENAEQVARQIGIAEIKDWIHAIQVIIWLARGDIEPAVSWAFSYSDQINDTVYPSIAIALAKVWLAQGQPEKALNLLEHALQSAQGVGRTGNANQILVVKALVQQMQGDLKNALVTLSNAVDMAMAEGYVRIFLDEGEPMRSLLTDFRTSLLKNLSSGTLSDKNKAGFDYTDQLLKAFTLSSISRSRKSIVQPPSASLPEPLSERELDVLRLIVAGLSNREIANQDVVSVNTVKTQVKSIYRKLGAHNRKDAIRIARELGLF